MAGAGLDLYRAADHVVADSVVHEVGDEALDKYPIAERGSSRQVGFDDDVGGSGRGAGLIDRVLRCRFEVHKFSGGQAAVGPGKGQQASMIASDWSSASRTRPTTVSSPSVVRVGLAMATSMRVRMEVSGVRSSCEALATNRRWLAKARSRRSNMSSKVSASSLSSSWGPSRPIRS